MFRLLLCISQIQAQVISSFDTCYNDMNDCGKHVIETLIYKPIHKIYWMGIHLLTANYDCRKFPASPTNYEASKLLSPPPNTAISSRRSSVLSAFENIKTTATSPIKIASCAGSRSPSIIVNPPDSPAPDINCPSQSSRLSQVCMYAHRGAILYHCRKKLCCNQ